jgi:methionine biosynthesis protein MetW
MRLDLAHIQRWIEHGSKVLDLGCGNGEFLQMLQEERDVRGLGLEIDPDKITAAVGRGLNIVEQDLDAGMDNFPDQSFDTVTIDQVLYQAEQPAEVLREALTVMTGLYWDLGSGAVPALSR